MLTIHTTGRWQRGDISVRRVPSTRKILPEVEAVIDLAWREGQKQHGWRLFDGPMCRLESWRGSDDRLEMDLSETSYRIFYGTNLSRPRLPPNVGREVMANPVGLSCALEARDGFLLFGRRNSSVAYYPNRIHPFAGSLDEQDLADVFSGVERELQEELSILPTDIASLRCLGILEDQTIEQPELIFHARVGLARSQIEQKVHHEEHRGSVAIEATRAALEQALANPREFTPVAMATLLLFGAEVFGEDWVECARLTIRV